jgi:predicted aspartyl protease
MRLNRAIVFVTLLLLAACQDPSAPSTTAYRCTVQRTAVLPVALVRGFLLVPGELNGNRAMFVVDTGAEATMVTPQATTEFGLDRDRAHRTIIHGIGGQITTFNARVMSFAIGNQELLDRGVAVGPLPNVPATEPQIAGLLGADYLSDYDLDLDVPHHTLTLYRMDGCGDNFVPPWHLARSIVPIRREHKDLLMLDVMVDGERINAMFDSGARVTTLSAAAAGRLGIDEVAMAHDRSITQSGVDRNAVSGHVHQFDQVQVGREVFHDPHLEIAALVLPNAEMLLGADYLRTRHIWVSYTARKLFVAPPGQ